MIWAPEPRIIEALQRAGLEVPDGRRITEQGYTTVEVRAIQKAFRNDEEA